MKSRLVTAAVLPFFVAGCTANDVGAIRPSGLPPAVEDLTFADTIAKQTALMASLAEAAGLIEPPPPGDARWFEVYKAGIALIDGQCDSYMDALFKFNRSRLAGQTTIAQTGAATGAILGLASAGQTAIAITAAAFGLSSSLFDAATRTVIFAFEPSTVRSVVRQAQDAWRDTTFSEANRGNYRSRPDVAIGLQGYLSLCTPAAIEAQINDAGSAAIFVPTSEETANPAPRFEQQSRRASLAQSEPETSQGDAAPPPARGLLPGEEGISIAQARRIQRALCNAGPTDGDFGGLGSRTRAAIAQAQTALSERNESVEPPEILGVLRATDVVLFATAGDCPDVFSTAYERFRYGQAPDYAQPSTTQVNGLQTQLGIPMTGVFDDATRAAIELKAEGGLTSKDDLARRPAE